ncbi:hypothetical protein E308F_27950 [Moorella sp. E308F]|jgi:hypothetical protein|uniref:hypothetical protein n=1 Tax=Moorella sp. E308F TaxID=2572682 RepID=UPI0010FFC717|nr:hypothetical protein [Moorella sp. E308F]GEA16549.1 hypothetical protein E308F_27950 [Moorella sp. E308F]
MLQVKFSYFARPRRGRCNCCDRQQTLEGKILLLEDTALIGDLILCGECAAAWGELLGQGREKVVQEWNFSEEKEGA